MRDYERLIARYEDEIAEHYRKYHEQSFNDKPKSIGFTLKEIFPNDHKYDYKLLCAAVFQTQLIEEGWFNSTVQVRYNAASIFLEVRHEGVASQIFFLPQENSCVMVMPISVDELNLSQSKVTAIAENVLNEYKSRSPRTTDDYDFNIHNMFLSDASMKSNTCILPSFFYEERMAFDHEVRAGLLFNYWVAFHEIAQRYLRAVSVKLQ